MDDQVAAAMTRWPNVPAVFGWLSLTPAGQWRLHPQGDAWDDTPAPRSPGARDSHADAAGTRCGEAITNPGILSFISRNYAGDSQGRWFFQNGPQRVFVRLDAAPFILFSTGTGAMLQTHTGKAVRQVAAWWLDDEGRLYARTEHGPGMLAGRDAMAVFDALCTSSGQPLLQAMELFFPSDQEAVEGRAATPAHKTLFGHAGTADTAQGGDAVLLIAPPSQNPADSAAPLYFCKAREIPRQLGFVRFPQRDGEAGPSV